MQVTNTKFPDLTVIQPKIFGDARGFFFESFNGKKFKELTGIHTEFVQDNMARSTVGVLRGLHYQTGDAAQAKLVSVIEGEVLDVVVDLRPESPMYGKHYKIRLTGENKTQLFVPRGFAHGYAVLSETALFYYKCDNYYAPGREGGVMYNDPAFNIDWEFDLSTAILSEKDLKHPPFEQHVPVN